MTIALYILRTVVTVGLGAVLACMFLRALSSWIPALRGGMLDTLTYAVTEPLIIPVRALLERIEWVRNAPIDVSFFITFFIISILFDALL